MHRILQVGLAPTDNLEQWLTQDAIQSITVLEPHPQQVKQLQQQYSGQPKLKIVAAALSAEPGSQTLIDYNLPGFSSLSVATGLKRLFPGLQAQRYFEVSTLSPVQFLAQYSPDNGQTTTLVIQAKGYESALIQELVNSASLLSFTEVLLYAAPILLYEDSTESVVLKQQLIKAGYELVHEQAVSPEWVEFSFKRNVAQDEIFLLKEQLTAKEAEYQKELAAEKATAEKHAEQTQKVQASLAEVKEEFVALQEQLTAKEAEHQKVLAAEKVAADKQAQLIKAQQAELEKVKKEISLTLENTKKEVQVKDKSIAQQQEELASAKQKQKQVAEQLQAIDEILKKHVQQLDNRKKQVEELEQALQLEQEKNKQLQAEKGTLTQLESRMEQLFNQQVGQIQQATNALGKHVTQSFADQHQHNQALIGLQQYLEKGEQPLNFDAWSMNADTLTHLVRQIEQNNYDVIIEFGSGASTVVMAKAIAQRLTSQRHHQITKGDSGKQLPYEDVESHSLPRVSESQAAALLDKAEYDLPRQILSFEQDRGHLKQTQQLLSSHGVNQVVELILAPLVPSLHTALSLEQKPLFYDCEKQLKRLARLFELRSARILVVVDGPFSPKNNPLIREPALAMVLQYLSAQQIDILLDDSQRSGEQQVLAHWRELCEERGLAYKEQPLDVVKGATWITVRPE